MSTLKPVLKSLFLTIAVEIRLEVLRLFLLAKFYILLTPSSTSGSNLVRSERTNARTKLFPTVLRICKQLYNEGISVLYGENTFMLMFSDSTIERVAACLPTYYNTAIRCAEISVMELLCDLEALPDSLKMLRLYIHRNQLGWMSNMMVNEEAKSKVLRRLVWLRERGVDTLKFDAQYYTMWKFKEEAVKAFDGN